MSKSLKSAKSSKLQSTSAEEVLTSTVAELRGTDPDTLPFKHWSDDEINAIHWDEFEGKVVSVFVQTNSNKPNVYFRVLVKVNMKLWRPIYTSIRKQCICLNLVMSTNGRDRKKYFRM